MEYNIIPDKFKPTKKKLFWSILVALIIDVLYWLVIGNTNIKDIIKPMLDWYVDNVVTMLFSISGIVILAVIFLGIYIIWSLIGRHNR
jgi:hypothetical protein